MSYVYYKKLLVYSFFVLNLKNILCLGYLNGWEPSKINRLASAFAAEIVMIKGALPEDDLVYYQYKKFFNVMVSR